MGGQNGPFKAATIFIALAEPLKNKGIRTCKRPCPSRAAPVACPARRPILQTAMTAPANGRRSAPSLRSFSSCAPALIRANRETNMANGREAAAEVTATAEAKPLLPTTEPHPLANLHPADRKLVEAVMRDTPGLSAEKALEMLKAAGM